MNQYGTQGSGQGGMGGAMPQEPSYPQYPPMSHNQQGFHTSYSAGGGNAQPPPPAMTQQQSFGPPASVAAPPPRTEGYRPPSMPDQFSAGHARPSRMSISHPPTSVSRRRSESQPNNHYGHLVAEEPMGDVPCSG
ncbi:hypothetical protein LPJ59_004847, partial [Coemansia sp. RSA 2399]